jgi:hypothetical protein
MREPVEFELQGLTFEFSQMPLAKACAALELLSELIKGSFAAGGDFRQAVAGACSAAIGKLPALINAYAPFCKVQGEGVAAGRKVALKTFQGEAFNGRLDLAILFVANCAAIEHADFLAEGLERIAAGLAELGQRFPSLTERIPGFGG